MPYQVYRHLRAAFLANWGHWVLEYLEDHGYEHGTGITTTDPVGIVLAWLWSRDPDEAAIFVAEYMAQIRDHDDLAIDFEPKPRFEDVLMRLPRAMPHGFDQTAALVEALREKVPPYYGGDMSS